MMRRLLATALICLPVPALAHPHIFIESGLIFLFDDKGRLEAIEITRKYDELYSLLLAEDMGLDRDGDGALTDEEEAALAGFDLVVEEGFTGELHVTKDEVPVALTTAHSPTARMEDGILVSTHIRPLAAPLEGLDGVTFKAFDPTFYAAFESTGLLAVRGRENCAVLREPADLDAAYTLVEELLYGPKSSQYNEDNYPEVGEAFADTLTIECGVSS